MPVFAAKPQFKYLDLKPFGPVGGRGGAVRFYMLANKINFDEQLISFQDWGAGEKAKCIEQDNPAGGLPVVTIGDKKYAQHIAINRFLARKTGQYGSDIEADAWADAAADAYTDWRNAWAKVLGEPDSDEAVIKYRDTRKAFYNTQEWYYAKKASPSSPYLSGGDAPGFVDCLVFNMIRDDGIKQGAVDLSPYPNLQGMYEALASNEDVIAWVKKWEAEVKAMAA